MKLKDKIRDKLRNWLLEDDLFQVEAAKKSYNDAVRKCVYANIQLSDAAVTYKDSYKLVDDCHKMMNSMVDVGTDVGFVLMTILGRLYALKVIQSMYHLFHYHIEMHMRYLSF